MAGVLVALLLLPSAFAETSDEFTLQGFGTAGMARTTTRDVEFVRDLSQPRGISDSWSLQNDSVIGVQGVWRINPQLEAVVQAMSRYSYNGSFNPELSWAYVKYEPTPNLSLRQLHEKVERPLDEILHLHRGDDLLVAESYFFASGRDLV